MPALPTVTASCAHAKRPRFEEPRWRVSFPATGGKRRPRHSVDEKVPTVANMENTLGERIRAAGSRAWLNLTRLGGAITENIPSDRRPYAQQLDDLRSPGYWEELRQGLDALGSFRTEAVRDGDQPTLDRIGDWARTQGRFPLRVKAALQRPNVTDREAEVGEHRFSGSTGYGEVRELLVDTFRDADASVTRPGGAGGSPGSAADREKTRERPPLKGTLTALQGRLATLRTLLDSDNHEYRDAALGHLADFRVANREATAEPTRQSTNAPAAKARASSQDASPTPATNRARPGFGPTAGGSKQTKTPGTTSQTPGVDSGLGREGSARDASGRDGRGPIGRGG